MIRPNWFLALVVTAVFGCAAPGTEGETPASEEENLGTTGQAVTEDSGDVPPGDPDYDDEMDGPRGRAIELKSFNPATGAIVGFNRRGQQVTGTVNAFTNFRQARVNVFRPGDPCRNVAISYNTMSLAGAAHVVGTIASTTCNARLAVSRNGHVRAFRLVR